MSISKFVTSLLSFILLFTQGSHAFSVMPNRYSSVSSSTTTSLQMTLLNYNGKKVDVPAGSPLKTACVKLGLKPKYSCTKGDCGSCTISIGGSRVKACVGKVPPEPKLKSLLENGLVVK